MQHCNHADQVKLPDVANISYKLLSYTVTWCVIAHACVGVSAYVCVCVCLSSCALYVKVGKFILLSQIQSVWIRRNVQAKATICTCGDWKPCHILFHSFYFISSCKKNIHTDNFTQKFMFNFWSFSWIKVIHFHIEQFSNQRLSTSTDACIKRYFYSSRSTDWASLLK